VLVVDDSAFMRTIVSDLISTFPEFTVIGTARDGHDALEKIHALDPDLVTLDVEMPVVDGLAALGYIMSEVPRPVVMLSAFDARGDVDLTIRALELGAVDFVRKPRDSRVDLNRVKERLRDALRAAAAVNLSAAPMLARPRRASRRAVRRPRGRGPSWPLPPVPVARARWPRCFGASGRPRCSRDRRAAHADRPPKGRPPPDDLRAARQRGDGR
jgi:two-component system chemotaxis response regulator CheB